MRSHGSNLVSGVAGAAADPRRVIVQQLAFQTEGRPDIILDLQGDLAILKDKSRSVCIKEGCIYNLKLTFKCVARLAVARARNHI